MAYIGAEPIVSATRTVTEVTATAGQTVFTANGGYTVGFLDVFINGSKLTSADFTATDGSTVTLTEAAQVNDIVRLEALGTFNTNSIQGNLALTGTAARITGDMTNSTVANRLAFQNSVTNGSTQISLFPNGTSNTSLVRVFNNSDPANCGTGLLYVDSVRVGLDAGITGTGTYLPLTMYTGGSERLRIDTSGLLGLGTTTMTRQLNIGNSTASVGVSLQNTGASGKNWSIFATNSGASIGGGNLGFYNDTDTAYRMILDGSGNLQFNSGYGSVATAYGCRAWVNFNGTGTVAIRGSGNVSSITDNGTGTYVVNFTNAMPDANYSWSGSATATSGSNMLMGNNSPVAPTASALAIMAVNAGVALIDPPYVSVSVFR